MTVLTWSLMIIGPAVAVPAEAERVECFDVDYAAFLFRNDVSISPRVSDSAKGRKPK